MKMMRFLSMAFCAFSLVAYTGCGDDAEVETTTTTTTTEPRDTTSVGSTVGAAGQEVGDESIEKLVETALIAKPGFENVTVESQPDGVIVLNGSVVSENQKAQAQVTAENTAGVKKVVNNLTIAQ